jgi:hypothetical protein
MPPSLPAPRLEARRSTPAPSTLSTAGGRCERLRLVDDPRLFQHEDVLGVLDVEDAIAVHGPPAIDGLGDLLCHSLIVSIGRVDRNGGFDIEAQPALGQVRRADDGR